MELNAGWSRNGKNSKHTWVRCVGEVNVRVTRKDKIRIECIRGCLGFTATNEKMKECLSMMFRVVKIASSRWWERLRGNEHGIQMMAVFWMDLGAVIDAARDGQVSQTALHIDVSSLRMVNTGTADCSNMRWSNGWGRDGIKIIRSGTCSRYAQKLENASSLAAAAHLACWVSEQSNGCCYPLITYGVTLSRDWDGPYWILNLIGWVRSCSCDTIQISKRLT